jgi:hypothetical protein
LAVRHATGLTEPQLGVKATFMNQENTNAGKNQQNLESRKPGRIGGIAFALGFMVSRLLSPVRRLR